MKPEDFIAELAPAAQKSARGSGIPASVILAQAALESGWGTSKLYRQGRNIFGMKASPYWHGNTLTIPTMEFIQGRQVTVDAVWRAYASFEESIADHAALLMSARRYQPCFAQKEAAGFARELQECGYSTNPRYAELLLQIIRTHNLTTYDAVAAA